MYILIPTMPDDTHAIQVQLALRAKGHNALLWCTADFPSRQTHAFELDQGEIQWISTLADGLTIKDSIHNQNFDIVWYRRPKAPILSVVLHEDDRKNSARENSAFFQNFWHIIAPDALWINSPDNARRANCKMLQLKIAMQIGLAIPKTLVSNDPAKIKTFIADNVPAQTIYKTFSPVAWYDPKVNLHLAYATNITVEDLTSDTILQSTAGIYQQKIAKAFELRITYFGTYGVAVKLRSQEHPKGQMDWRAIPTHELIIEPYEIPQDINEKCIALMRKLGLLFGCFDFIVTPDNEYYFLEINEQGQFLWIEELNPDIKMLDIFVEFLIAKGDNFSYKFNENSISLLTFKDEMLYVQDKMLEQHLHVPAW